MLLIITSTGDRLFRFITSTTLNDFEPLNFSKFLDAGHISTLNYDKMVGDRPRQPASEIFSIKRKF